MLKFIVNYFGYKPCVLFQLVCRLARRSQTDNSDSISNERHGKVSQLYYEFLTEYGLLPNP
jgi:hypothetical protein